MVKRPLVWILCAYLAGMYLEWQGLPRTGVFILILPLVLFIYTFMYKISNKLVNSSDKFLWCLPVLLLLGFFAMKDQRAEPQLSKAFDQQIACDLSGNISMIVKKQWGKALYLKNNTVSLSGGEQYLCGNVIVFCYENQSSGKKPDRSTAAYYLIGNQITVHGTLLKFSRPRNPGQFNEKLYYQIQNIDYKLKAEHIQITDAGFDRFHLLLNSLKDKLLTTYQTILPEKEAGTVIAMILGENYLLDDEIKQLYQVNGISHVLAISGLHISLLGMFMFGLLKKLRLPPVAATFITIFFIYCYGVLTNFSVSTNRAVVMMTIMLLSALIGKTYDMMSSISLSAFLILLQNPLQIMSAGFLLSFGAVIGIAVLYPSLQKLYETKNPVISSIYISVSAQLTTTPFISFFYYQFPTYGILTNLLILPFVTLLTLTSVLSGIVGVFCEPLGMFLIGGSNYILKFYELVCRIFRELPASLITTGKPGNLRLIIYTMLLILFQRLVTKYKRKFLLLIPVLALILLLIPIRNSLLEVTMLDVGQGDAIYMESRNGTTYLMDGGSTDVTKPGINRIQPFLLSKGTDHLDYVFISHSDQDHINGIKELMEEGRIKISTLVLPLIGNKDEAYLNLESLAKRRKITVQYICKGDKIMDGEMMIYCLHPTSGYQAASANAYSTVLSVTYGAFDMLLTGDLEQDGEEEVLQLLKDKTRWMSDRKDENSDILVNDRKDEEWDASHTSDMDVLKVAHHGSKYSTLSEFLHVVKPKLSLISCGKGNSYGHPHQELLQRLQNINSKILITYDTGAITIKTDGDKITVGEFR